MLNNERGYMTEIKSCPFCGEAPEEYFLPIKKVWVIECMNNKCFMQTVSTGASCFQEKTRERWNKRK